VIKLHENYFQKIGQIELLLWMKSKIKLYRKLIETFQRHYMQSQ